MVWNHALPNVLAASCCCAARPDDCTSAGDGVRLQYSSISRSVQTTCTKTCEPGSGASTLNCKELYQYNQGLQIYGGDVELLKGRYIRENGWYSDSWLKGGNMMVNGIKWPNCGTYPCLDPVSMDWNGAPRDGVSKYGTTNNAAYFVYDEGRSANYGDFGQYTYSYVNPDCQDSVAPGPCWDCETVGDLLPQIRDYHGLSPVAYTLRTAKLECISLGGGKTAWSGTISLFAPGTHSRKLHRYLSGTAYGCCDWNRCECNGQLGCGRSGPEFWCFDREGGGVFNPCDPEQPHDERCICECTPWSQLGTCFEAPSSTRCTEGSNCACNQNYPGEFNGCAWGLGNGYDGTAGAACQAFRNHYGLPYANCFCPQMDTSYWCYGPNISNFNNCTQASQFQSCHPDCSNDPDGPYDDGDGGVAEWVSCQNPRVQWGKLIQTYTIQINPLGLVNNGEVPHCYGCTAQEYFDTFASGEYYAKGPSGEDFEIKVR